MKKTNNIEKVFYDNSDDEIEEFSSQEDLIRGKNIILLRNFKTLYFLARCLWVFFNFSMDIMYDYN